MKFFTLRSFPHGKSTKLLRSVQNAFIDLVSSLNKRKLLMRINLIMIAMTAFLLRVSATASYAQELTLHLENAPLKEVFAEITKQTGFTVFYKSQDIKKARPVTVKFAGTPLKEALGLLLGPENLDYAINEKAIVIREKERKRSVITIPDETAHTQNITVIGKVMDSEGQPAIGATIRVKGTNIATITNSNGDFTLKEVEEDAIIIVSYIGFAVNETRLDHRTTITIVLKENRSGLNEVLVVGYGTQKKVNLTGAVDNVGSEYFDDRPLPNVTRGLQGVIPNLNIKMTDGKPTRSSSYNIRGITTINSTGADALIVIDGVPANDNSLVNNINPNDIASVTVLKDAASAAIYGARGAFGVVLITTKNPQKGKVQLNYSANYSRNEQTVRPHFVTDSYTWAKTFNEAFAGWNDYNVYPTDINGVYPFSQSYLDEIKRHSEDPSLPKVDVNAAGNYVYYNSNTDWIKELYKDSNPSMEHALSITGGSDKVNFSLSGRFYNQDGIYRYSPDKYNRYNLRFKGDIKINDWLSANTIVDFSSYSYKYPLTSFGGKNAILRLLAVSAFPVAPVFNPDGTLTRVGATGVGDFYYGKSFSFEQQTFIRNTVGLNASVIKDKLNIKADFSYLYTNTKNNYKYIPVPYSNAPGVVITSGINDLTNNTANRNYYVGNIYADFTQSFGDHHIKLLGGWNLEYDKLTHVNVSRDGLLLDNLSDFNLATGTNIRVAGGGQTAALSGVFFRGNYDYKGKYLLEVDGRYDGSSKFPVSKQFGFFPSMSAGWRISEEHFMAGTRNWLDNLKFRGSYGSLGNGNIAPYTFLQAITASRGTVLVNGAYPSYIQQPGVVSQNLTWETATTLDFGMDADLLRQRLSMSFDWYNRKTTGMILPGTPLPAVFGAAVPKENNGDLSTKGWELSLAWRGQINMRKPLKYGVRVTLSDNETYITKFYNPTGTMSSSFKGQKWGDIYGFVSEGLFQSEDEIAKHADQSYIKVSILNKWLPGDVKFKDLNGDGKIDRGLNTLADPGDVTVIGNSLPRYAYGFTGDVEWNNFSISAFIQGIGKRDWWPSVEAAYFWGPYNRPYTFLPAAIDKNRWTPENPNGYYPRLRTYTSIGSTPELAVQQSRYLQNASYIRLKDLTIGYTLPVKLVNKAGLTNARVFLTGQNLWTWSPMYRITKDFDPEVIEGSDPEVATGQGDGFSYPMLKTYTAGVNLTF